MRSCGAGVPAPRPPHAFAFEALPAIGGAKRRQK